MSKGLGASSVAALVVVAAAVAAGQQNTPTAPIPPGLPEWAYTPPVPGAPPPPSALPADDAAVVRIPGTDKTFTRGQLRAQKETMDWHPEDPRGTAPEIVRFGKQGARQCNLCHLPDGSGRPENAPISSLHPAYFMQQMQDFRDGLKLCRSTQVENESDDWLREVDDDRRGSRRCRVLRPAAVPAPHQGRRIEDRAEGADARRMHMAIPAREGGGISRSRPTRLSRSPTTTSAPRRAIRAWAGPRRAPGHAEPRQAGGGQSPVRHVPRSRTSRESARCRRWRSARPAMRCGSCSTSRPARGADRGAS